MQSIANSGLNTHNGFTKVDGQEPYGFGGQPASDALRAKASVMSAVRYNDNCFMGFLFSVWTIPSALSQ